MYISKDEITFTGKSGCIITLARNESGNFTAWIRDDENSTETDGYSVTGTLPDVIRDIIDEF